MRIAAILFCIALTGCRFPGQPIGLQNPIPESQQMPPSITNSAARVPESVVGFYAVTTNDLPLSYPPGFKCPCVIEASTDAVTWTPAIYWAGSTNATDFATVTNTGEPLRLYRVISIAQTP